MCDSVLIMSGHVWRCLVMCYSVLPFVIVRSSM